MGRKVLPLVKRGIVTQMRSVKSSTHPIDFVETIHV
jgi:hypothetical protein